MAWLSSVYTIELTAACMVLDTDLVSVGGFSVQMAGVLLVKNGPLFRPV